MSFYRYAIITLCVARHLECALRVIRELGDEGVGGTHVQGVRDELAQLLLGHGDAALAIPVRRQHINSNQPEGPKGLYDSRDLFITCHGSQGIEAQYLYRSDTVTKACKGQSTLHLHKTSLHRRFLKKERGWAPPVEVLLELVGGVEGRRARHLGAALGAHELHRRLCTATEEYLCEA